MRNVKVCTTDVVEKLLDDSASIAKLSHLLGELHQQHRSAADIGEAIKSLLDCVEENLTDQLEREAKDEADAHETHPGAA